MGYTVISEGQRDCISCGERKPISEFYCYAYTTRQGKRSTRSDSRCRMCGVLRRRQHYSANRARSCAVGRRYKALNKEAVSARVASYRGENRERLLRSKVISQHLRRVAAGSFNNTESRYAMQCAFDAAKFGDKYLDSYSGELIEKPSLDHIEPLSRGGAHRYDNFCITSLFNNTSKNNKPLLIWLLERAS